MKRQQLTVTFDLARYLAAHGVASLRYDKRGVGDSEGSYHSTGFEDNVADANAAITALQAEVEVSRMFVVGHSEGALIATRLAAQHAPVDSVVLLAGAARSGEDILRHRAGIANESLPGFVRFLLKLFRTDVVKGQRKRIAQLKATTTDAVRIQFVKVNAKWFREFMAYNPGEDFANIRVPILAITGQKDLQVPPADLQTMTQLAPGPIETHEPDDLTHLLRLDLDEPTLKGYKKQLKQPTDQGLMDLVTTWLNRHSP